MPLSLSAVALSLSLALVLTGCMAKRDNYDIPEVELPKTFRFASKDQSAAAIAGEAAPMTIPQSISRWWTHFGNEELNGLVTEALANNYQLKAAIARIAQAEAQHGAEFAGEWPVLSGSGSAEVSGPVGGIGSLEPGDKNVSEKDYQVGLNISYEVDLWGKNRAATEAALERAWANVFARETVALTLSAEVTQNFIEYLSVEDRIRTAKRTKTALLNMLGAVQDRLDGGEATSLQLAQQRAAVADAKAVIPVLDLLRNQKLIAIALLLGKSPSDVDIESNSLTDITFPEVNPGLPSRLLMRRPDIRKAEAELIAADADIDAARAELLPTFKLTAERGYGSKHLQRLLSPESLFFSAAATITQVIFDAGKRQSDIEFAEAKHGELVHNYMRASYAAMKEVEESLVAIRYLTLRKDAQGEAVDASQAAYDLSAVSYTFGTLDYLTLLDTERTLYRNEDELHTIEFERYRAAVDLFKSLGGGMEPDDVKVVEARQKIKSSLETGILSDEAPRIPEESVSAGLPEKGFWIQMAATWNEKAAWRHWRKLRNRYPTMLKNHKPTIEREPASDDQGTWVSMLLGPFDSRNNADGLCTAFRDEGQGCQILVR